MRRGAAVALLVATGGCNAIFGLNGNLIERDASPYEGGIDSPYYSMQLTWQVLETPTGPIDYPPIAGATVALGPIDTPAELHPLTLNSDGSFYISNTTPKPYRLVYTVDSLPTEIQTSLESGHFVVPLVGRIARGTAPSHALVNFNPSGAPGSVITARVMTVGLWTLSNFSPGNDTFLLPHTYDYQTTSVSMSGVLGSPSATDYTVIMDVTGGHANGFAVAPLDQPLNPNPPGPTSNATGTWRTAPSDSLAWNVPNTPGGTYDPNKRMMSVLGPYNPANNAFVGWGGVIPSELMPAFVEPVPGALDELQFAPLSTNYSSPHTFANPFEGTDQNLTLKTAVFTQDTNFRMVGGLRLTSGFQGIELQPTGGAPADTTYKVGIAHVANQDVTLTPAGGTPVVLVGTEGQTLTLGGAKLVDLKFSTDLPVDDCVVTIYLVEASSLTPVRRLLLQQPPAVVPFRIDATVFAPTKTYVLGVVCRKGQPGVASVGDYTQISYPYQTSTLYTRTFVVAP